MLCSEAISVMKGPTTPRTNTSGLAMIKLVKDYFDTKADGYRDRSGSTIWTFQRNREARVIGALMGNVSGERLLDLGCGAGHYTRHFLRNGAAHVTAVDFSEKMISKLTDQRVTGIVADATNAQFDEVFSGIVCAGLLEFVFEPEAVLRNARKFVLKDSRMICLVPPASWAGQLYRCFHRANRMRINLFSNDDFKSICRNAGWEIDAKVSVFPYSNVYRLKPLVVS